MKGVEVQHPNNILRKLAALQISVENISNEVGSVKNVSS